MGNEDNDNILSFNIYFSDLTKEAQEKLCEEFNTTAEEENWDVFPLFCIERYEDI